MLETSMKTLDSKLMDMLEEKYGPLWWPEDFYPEDVQSDPFKHIVITVLSQNTSETNCIRAYKRLTAKFEITPKTLAYVDEEKIREAIRSGGLYNVKAKRIKELSKTVLEKFPFTVRVFLTRKGQKVAEHLVEIVRILAEKTG